MSDQVRGSSLPWALLTPTPTGCQLPSHALSRLQLLASAVRREAGC